MNLKAALEGTLAIARAEALAATEKLVAEALAKESAADDTVASMQAYIRKFNADRREKRA